MKKYDVAVVGGGFAGVGAALAAARGGAEVILIEKGNCLGGAAVHALVNPFMPSFIEVDGIRTELSAGIFGEIKERLVARDAYVDGRFLEEELKYILNEMMLEAGVSLLYHAYIFRANTEGGKIVSVSLATKSGETVIEAENFIDATGDAQLAYLTGCPTVLGREGDNLCQPMTLCFRLGNVDIPKFYAGREKMKAKYTELYDAGEFINPRENILHFRMPISNVLHLNTTRVVKKNPTDPIDFSEAEIIARKQAFEVYDFMKKHADGLENSYLMMTASEIGVRESRMIVGEYTLTCDDCKNCTKFEDAVVACNYDMDIHNPEGKGTSHYFFKPDEYYTIPYRCLIPKEASNLLVAGRCISSDHYAQASYRIMPVVCCIGEAAGTAVALALKNKITVREVNVKELQSTLKNNNAFVGI